MFFMRRHVKAIEDNIDQVNHIFYQLSTVSSINFNTFTKSVVDRISNVINCNLYDDYHHSASVKFHKQRNRYVILTGRNVSYQTIAYDQLYVELKLIMTHYQLMTATDHIQLD